MRIQPIHAATVEKYIFRACFHRAAILITLCMVSGVFLLPATMAAEKAPRTASLSLRDMSGKRISLHSLRGQVVVLNFWATWCGPCNVEMPMLVAAERQYRQRGVVFLGASVDDSKTQKSILAFLDRYHVTYTILTGASADDLAKLKLGIAVPATAFVDAKGVIRFRILGQMHTDELQERIDWLLHDEAGPAPAEVVTHLDEK